MFIEKDEDWKDYAACRQKEIPLSQFFEDFEAAHNDIPRRRRLIAVCQTCPVVNQCAEFARKTKSTGVFGGAYYVSGKPRSINYNPKKKELAT